MARVRVSDESWADFRALAGDRPVAVVLGELVEQEVERYRAQRIRDGQADDRELLDALARAPQLREELGALVARIERRLDLATTVRPSPPPDELA